MNKIIPTPCKNHLKIIPKSSQNNVKSCPNHAQIIPKSSSYHPQIIMRKSSPNHAQSPTHLETPLGPHIHPQVLLYRVSPAHPPKHPIFNTMLVSDRLLWGGFIIQNSCFPLEIGRLFFFICRGRRSLFGVGFVAVGGVSVLDPFWHYQ